MKSGVLEILGIEVSPSLYWHASSPWSQNRFGVLAYQQKRELIADFVEVHVFER